MTFRLILSKQIEKADLNTLVFFLSKFDTIRLSLWPSIPISYVTQRVQVYQAGLRNRVKLTRILNRPTRKTEFDHRKTTRIQVRLNFEWKKFALIFFSFRSVADCQGKPETNKHSNTPWSRVATLVYIYVVLRIGGKHSCIETWFVLARILKYTLYML